MSLPSLPDELIEKIIIQPHGLNSSWSLVSHKTALEYHRAILLAEKTRWVVAVGVKRLHRICSSPSFSLVQSLCLPRLDIALWNVLVENCLQLRKLKFHSHQHVDMSADSGYDVTPLPFSSISHLSSFGHASRVIWPFVSVPNATHLEFRMQNDTLNQELLQHLDVPLLESLQCEFQGCSAETLRLFLQFAKSRIGLPFHSLRAVFVLYSATISSCEVTESLAPLAPQLKVFDVLTLPTRPHSCRIDAQTFLQSCTRLERFRSTCIRREDVMKLARMQQPDAPCAMFDYVRVLGDITSLSDLTTALELLPGLTELVVDRLSLPPSFVSLQIPPHPNITSVAFRGASSEFAPPLLDGLMRSFVNVKTLSLNFDLNPDDYQKLFECLEHVSGTLESLTVWCATRCGFPVAPPLYSFPRLTGVCLSSVILTPSLTKMLPAVELVNAAGIEAESLGNMPLLRSLEAEVWADDAVIAELLELRNFGKLILGHAYRFSPEQLEAILTNNPRLAVLTVAAIQFPTAHLITHGHHLEALFVTVPGSGSVSEPDLKRVWSMLSTEGCLKIMKVVVLGEEETNPDECPEVVYEISLGLTKFQKKTNY